MKYSADVMEKVRQNMGLDEHDTSQDAEIELMSHHEVFRRVLEWEGLLGSWATAIRVLVRDIYGVTLGGQR